MSEALPSESAGDHLHRATRAALASIPFAGGAAVELFNLILAPPIQRRRDEWLNALAERLGKLEQDGRVIIAELRDNDEFVSTVMQASQLAVRNHRQEKIDALRNAVLNTALEQAPEDSKRELFLRWIDELGVWHLRLLALLADPPGWFERNGKKIPEFAISSSLHQVIEAGMPELARDRGFIEVVAKDLDDRHLASSASFMTVMTPRGAVEKRTSDLGDAFLRFITEPGETP